MQGTMGDTSEQSERTRSVTRIAIWACVGALGSLGIAAVLYIYFSADPVVAKYRELARFYSSRQEVKAFLHSFGPYAPLPFIVLQALQVVFAPIPGRPLGFWVGTCSGLGWDSCTPRSVSRSAPLPLSGWADGLDRMWCAA